MPTMISGGTAPRAIKFVRALVGVPLQTVARDAGVEEGLAVLEVQDRVAPLTVLGRIVAVGDQHAQHARVDEDAALEPVEPEITGHPDGLARPSKRRNPR